MRAAHLPTLLLLLAAACGAPAPRAAPPPPEPPLPAVTLYGVRLSVFRGDRLAVAGRAAKATYDRDTADVGGSEVLLRMPSVGGVAAPGGGAGRAARVGGAEVRAPEVLGNLSSLQADALGGVLLRTSTGIVGRTERVHYDGPAHQVRSVTPSVVQAPNYALSGERFTFFVPEERFVFEGDVRATLEGAR